MSRLRSTASRRAPPRAADGDFAIRGVVVGFGSHTPSLNPGRPPGSPRSGPGL